MNTIPLTLTLNVTGELTIDPKNLEQLFQGLRIRNPNPSPTPTAAEAPTRPQTSILPTQSNQIPRLAYSIHETAQMLGFSYKSVYRLIERGLLRGSGALRHRRIPLKEIEWFLRETTVH